MSLWWSLSRVLWRQSWGSQACQQQGRFSSDSVNKCLCGRYVVAYKILSMEDHSTHFWQAFHLQNDTAHKEVQGTKTEGCKHELQHINTLAVTKATGYTLYLLVTQEMWGMESEGERRTETVIFVHVPELAAYWGMQMCRFKLIGTPDIHLWNSSIWDCVYI